MDTIQQKNILFVTGTRADFSKLKSLMQKVNKDKMFNCFIFATGMHLLKKYGHTIDDIELKEFSHVFQFYNQTIDMNNFMDIILANTIKGLSFYVSENRPDLIIIHGDRVEALAGAVVGALQGIRTAHIEGGELSGSVDELLRHAVTKLSHIHFTSTEENKKRLIQLGEDKNNIFVIGSADIDIMLANNIPDVKDVYNRYKIPFKEYSIFIYHPVVTELENLKNNINEIVEALKISRRNFIIIYPNNDKGSDIILNKLKELEYLEQFRLFKSIKLEDFLALLRHAQCIVGNSSCGIHEAPLYGIPTINIGSRQNGRFIYKSILNVNEDKNKIIEALQSLPFTYDKTFNYGTGNSSQLFIEALHSKRLWEIPLQKTFIDMI